MDETLLISVFVGVGVTVTLTAVNFLLKQRRIKSRKLPIALTVIAAMTILFGLGIRAITGSAGAAISAALVGALLAMPMAAIIWLRMEESG